MLFKNIDFEDKEVIRKFSIKGATHTATLENYYRSYNAILELIIRKGLQKNYELNSKARGVLFLIRHSFELCLKYNLQLQGADIPSTHEFASLIQAYPNPSIVSPDLISVFEMVNFDEAGASFRYYYDKNKSKPYFRLGDRIEVSEILKRYNAINPPEGFVLGKISEPFDYDNRVKKWDLTFHMGESFHLGNVRSEFDGTIEFIIEQILDNEVDIKLIYLPLFFLIRHSLELALKSNISEIQEFSTLIKSSNYQNEHSLSSLYNVYSDYLNKIDIKALPEALVEQYDLYKSSYDKLNETLHQLDSNSRRFRFPSDKVGNVYLFDITKINLIQILKLYYFSDAYITFTNVVLSEHGILH